MQAVTVTHRIRMVALSAFVALGGSLSSGCGRVSNEPEDALAPNSGGDPNTPLAGGADSGSAGRFAGGDAGSSDGGNSGTNGRPANGGAGGAITRDCGPLIDDMEDGSGRICFGTGRIGVWYSFKDPTQKSTQWPSATTPGTPIETSLIPGDRGTSKRAIHTYGSCWGWGSGVGIDLNFDGTTYALYDATDYQGVHFWARGTNTELRFRVGAASTTARKYGGTCATSANGECAGPTGVSLTLAPEWREYSVNFGALGVAGERDRLTNIQFMTKGDFDFWIDDVSFVEGKPNCCTKIPECESGAHLSDAVLRSALNADETNGELGCDRVCDLTRLNLYNPAIESLAGLECLGALESLQVQQTAVDDPTPVSRLAGLRELDLSDNRIENLGPAFELPKLERLMLWGNAIRDVSALSKLSALTALDLSGNQVTDARPLAALSQLTSLNLNSNQVETPLSALSGLLNLQYLQLHGNQITSLGSMAQLPALNYLTLDDNQLTDVGDLGSLTSLVSLNLANNSIQSLSAAFSLAALGSIDLSNNRLTAIPETALINPNFENLILVGNEIRDLTPFAHVVIRSLLDLSDNQVEDLTPLLGAKGLSTAYVELNGNPVDCSAQAATLQTLRSRGTNVHCD